MVDLAKKFEGVACETTLFHRIGPEPEISLSQAKRFTTRIAATVVLTVKGEGATPSQVFLPRRYCDVITDTDIEQINSIAVFLHLVYKGVCPTTEAYLLEIEI